MNIKTVEKLVNEVRNDGELSFLAGKDNIEIFGSFIRVFGPVYRVFLKVKDNTSGEKTEWHELTFGRNRAEKKLKKLVQDLRNDGWIVVDNYRPLKRGGEVNEE